MSKIEYYKFKLPNPNRGISYVGWALLALFAFSLFKETMEVVIGFGVLVKILVLIWIPKAARLVGRNRIGWTIFAFLTPSVALIILENVGYKAGKEKSETIEKCNNILNKKQDELQAKLDKQEINEEEFWIELNEFHTELQEKARENLNAIFDIENTSFLDDQLKKKGYVIDEDSEVFVDFNDKCPACGALLSPDLKECPDCGLQLG